MRVSKLCEHFVQYLYKLSVCVQSEFVISVRIISVGIISVGLISVPIICMSHICVYHVYMCPICIWHICKIYESYLCVSYIFEYVVSICVVHGATPFVRRKYVRVTHVRAVLSGGTFVHYPAILGQNFVPKCPLSPFVCCVLCFMYPMFYVFVFLVNCALCFMQ